MEKERERLTDGLVAVYVGMNPIRLNKVPVLVLVTAFIGCTDEQPHQEGDAILVEVVVHDLAPTYVTLEGNVFLDDVLDAAVEYGSSLPYSDEVPVFLDPDGAFSVDLHWLRSDAEYHYRVRLDTADGPVQTADATFVTGAAPAHLPRFDVYSPFPAEVEGGHILTSLITYPPAVVIFDREGDYVWWHVPDEDTHSLISRAHLSRDGQSVTYLEALGGFDNEGGADNSLVRVGLDGVIEERIPVPGCHHDFVELPDGTFALLCTQHQEIEGSHVFGDAIVEIAPDGGETVVWSAFEHLDFDPAYEDHGWTHANALDFFAQENAYYLSLRNYDAIHKIDRATGEEIWRLGGDFSDFLTATAQTDLFGCQHQFDVLDDGIVVFDNRDDPALPSRVVEYTLDTEQMRVQHAWHHVVDPPLHVVGLGDARRLPGGNTLVVWSSMGQMDEISAAGEVVWRLNMPIGGGFGYGVWLESGVGPNR